MRILFDQATPVPIRSYLVGHVVRTAAQEGWDKLRNGDLLTVAEEAGFDLLLTSGTSPAERSRSWCLASSNGRRFALTFST
jgi:hypothetical protein